MRVSLSGHVDEVKFLLERGANVNAENIDVSDLLLDTNVQGNTSLMAASNSGHKEVVEILLKNGADVNHVNIHVR